MEPAAPALFVALEQSAFAAAIRQSMWLYPAANVGHIAALVCFAAAVAAMDLRLIGLFAETPPGPTIARFRRAALLALLGLAGTGFLLFAAEAGHVIVNPVFLAKLALIALGIANVAAYEAFIRYRVEAVPPRAALPRAARIAGYASLGLWLAVAICGRSIAYF
jgi:hypothetical protein